MKKGRRVKKEKCKKGALLERTLIKLIIVLALIKIFASDFNLGDMIELVMFVSIGVASMYLSKLISLENEVFLKVDKES